LRTSGVCGELFLGFPLVIAYLPRFANYCFKHKAVIMPDLNQPFLFIKPVAVFFFPIQFYKMETLFHLKQQLGNGGIFYGLIRISGHFKPVLHRLHTRYSQEDGLSIK
jgi:hypothetical protein